MLLFESGVLKLFVMYLTRGLILQEHLKDSTSVMVHLACDIWCDNPLESVTKSQTEKSLHFLVLF